MTEMEINGTLDMKDGRRTIDFVCEKDELCQIPIATNPKKIKSHVKLVLMDDVALTNLAKQMKDKGNAPKSKLV